MADERNETVSELESRIAESNDANALRAELEGETRTTARDAIEARIEELEGVDMPAELVEDSSDYSREELIAGAAGFGTTAETVAGALRLEGRSRMTRQEAADAIRAFEEREV